MLLVVCISMCCFTVFLGNLTTASLSVFDLILSYDLCVFTDVILRTLGEGTFGKVVCCKDR